jgi:PEP-CTERM motif-containing protein
MRNATIGVLLKIAFIGSLVLLTAGTVSADSIIYTFTGTGSGTVGTSNFLNQSISITVLGNTENVINAMAGIFVNASLNTSIDIPSIATIRVEDLTNMFSNSTPNGAGIGIGDSTLHLALFGLIPANSYNLTSDFGPLFNANPVAATEFVNVATSEGTLDMTSWTNVTFNASLSAVPEPGSVLLLSVGLLGAAVMGLRKRLPNNNHLA